MLAAPWVTAGSVNYRRRLLIMKREDDMTLDVGPTSSFLRRSFRTPERLALISNLDNQASCRHSCSNGYRIRWRRWHWIFAQGAVDKSPDNGWRKTRRLNCALKCTESQHGLLAQMF